VDHDIGPRAPQGRLDGSASTDLDSLTARIGREEEQLAPQKPAGTGDVNPHETK
jgi:hypothetical protein